MDHDARTNRYCDAGIATINRRSHSNLAEREKDQVDLFLIE